MKQVQAQEAKLASEQIKSDPLRQLVGSRVDEFNSHVLRRVAGCVQPNPYVAGSPEYADVEKFRLGVVTGALADFAPQDAIEGMIAAQAVAMHLASMDCFRRGMLDGQPLEIASKHRRDGANLARGMCDMVEAIDKKRGKGQQHIRVERVMVSEGGKAIVGNVSHGAGRQKGAGAVDLSPETVQGERGVE